MDLDEIIENVFMRATEFMHHSGLRMDADHVGKPQDLYLWCSVGGRAGSRIAYSNKK
jgi:hypothetical protein